MKTLLCISMTLLPLLTVGQTNARIDSMEKLLANAVDTQRIQLLIDLADEYEDINPDHTLACASEAEKIAHELGRTHDEASSIRYQGSAMRMQGNMPQAVNQFVRALRLCEANGDIDGMAAAYNSLGYCYSDMDNMQQSLYYFRKSYEAKKELGDKKGMAATINNMGTIYAQLDSIAEALKSFNIALHIREEIKDVRGIASTLSNIGRIYLIQQKYKLALDYQLRSLQIRRTIDDKKGIANTLNNIGEIYIKTKEYSKATESLTEGLHMAETIGSKALQRDSYWGLSEVYESSGDYANALKYAKMRSNIQDVLLSEEGNRQIEEMRTRYESEKKEQHIKLLQKDNELTQVEIDRKQQFIYTFIIAAVVVSLLLFFLTALYRQKTEANLKLIQLDKEKNEFLGIAAHDLKNPLQTIMGYCQMQVEYFDKLSKDKILKYTSHIEQSARKMIVLISNLLDINAIEQGTIRSNPEAIHLAEFISKANQNFEVSSQQKDITIHSSCPEDLILRTDRYMLSQVYENLLSNALKYSPLHTAVWVKAEQQQNKILITIRDSGPGIPEGEADKLFKKFSRLSSRPTAGESSSGLGLSIVKKLCEMLQADVRCESQPGHGATFTVTFTQRVTTA